MVGVSVGTLYRAQSQPHAHPAGPPRVRRALWAARLSRRAAAAPCVHQTDEHPGPPDGPPDALSWRTPVPFRWNPHGSSCLGQLAWRAGPGSASLCNRRLSIESSSRRGRPQATLPALEASCLPSSCDGISYRRARTRRTPSRWRGQPSAGWGTGL